MQVIEYESREFDIPDSFLKQELSQPITYKDVSFATSDVVEYKDHTAFVLDNVLSPDECQQLIAMAEYSVPRNEAEDRSSTWSPWKPALVSGFGGESLMRSYRNSGRIVWDQQDLVDRVWERCAQTPEVWDAVNKVNEISRRPGGKWVFRGPNKRMRFLKYTQGQFFKRAPYPTRT